MKRAFWHEVCFSAQSPPVECTADPGPRPALWKHTVIIFTVWLSDQLTFYTVNNGVLSTPPTDRSAPLLRSQSIHSPCCYATWQSLFSSNQVTTLQGGGAHGLLPTGLFVGVSQSHLLSLVESCDEHVQNLYHSVTNLKRR